MNKIEIKELEPKRFNALAGYSRSPAAAYMSAEIGWYTNEDESILGVLLLDTTDNDYAAIVMAQDVGGRYRAFDLKCSIVSQEDATNWLINTMKWHTGQDFRLCSQVDKTQTPDLFSPITSIEKQHPYFTHLARDIAYLPAKEIINKMMHYFVDIDGNFVQQFQTTGFDARLWELYLFAYFVEDELFIERTKKSPDFIVKKYGKTVAVEAVIVGRKKENPPRYFKKIAKFKTLNPIRDNHIDEMSIKFGSPLYSKLQKKYWDLPHVQGHPLVFAIADFHDDQSMLWSSTALINYLYGIQHDFFYDNSNKLIITPFKIESHKASGKEIPSGFFSQPDSEFISGVIFSASGTISKFNRIGRQAGYYDPRITMFRRGTCHNHNSNAILPNLFQYIVDEKSNETWAQGLSLFHNPNARYPVPEELFPSIAHHNLVDGQIISRLPEFHPYASMTYNFRIA